MRLTGKHLPPTPSLPAWPLTSPLVAALLTGLRWGELRALRWEDVHLQEGYLTVQCAFSREVLSTTKSSRVRHVPMPFSLVERLSALPRREGFVFGRGGVPLSYEQGRAALGRACTAAGIGRIGWHALRHTYASTLAMHGVPLYDIQKLLGHSSSAMTERYAHLSPTRLRASTQVLASLFQKSGQPVGSDEPIRAFSGQVVHTRHGYFFAQQTQNRHRADAGFAGAANGN